MNRCALPLSLACLVLSTGCPADPGTERLTFTTGLTFDGDGDGDSAETGAEGGTESGSSETGDGDGYGDSGDGDGDGDGDSGDGDDDSGDGDGDTGPLCGNAVVDPGEECDVGNETMFCDADCTFAVCGDGYHNTLSEECDDGNSENTDGCVGPCELATCGDTFVQEGVEECDDGNQDNDDDCTSQCMAAVCGDGFVHAQDEECDDANMIDTDACTAQCTASYCGDGVLWEGMETCDDGNMDDTDACPTSCEPAVCGDGFVHAGFEDCDDGNMIDDDFCANDCTGIGYTACFESDFGVLNNGDPWVICSIDQNSAWVAANTGGTYQADEICNFLGFNTLSNWGGTCGDVCGYCEGGASSCQNPGSMNFDGGGDGNFPQLSFTVHWLCTNN
ncbi:hypothetical protein ENSA5_62910 [Enhygromyxa salina]|uniref:Multiple EGF-like-domain protein 3 n=1 Tax=Enhygromyxa salina TaxID=215803 RepID=A0A2S9XCT5_9BACT|nr:hypothetical protein [Enhygromyxa salina]PRP90672.1 hypothetical protein ENSA5_62910 [Enhygromyxa salina]